MKRTIITAAAMLVLAGVVHAAPIHKNKRQVGPISGQNGVTILPTIQGGSRPVFVIPNYHLRYGTRFSHGYFYRGFHHTHWSKVYFNPIYGCKIYYDPFTRTEYYWCPWDNCFYPVKWTPYGRYRF